MIIFNTNPEDLVKSEHVCYYTKSESFDKISLYQVVKNFFKHPDVPEHALISNFDTEFIDQFDRSSQKASDLILLEAAQKTTERLRLKNYQSESTSYVESDVDTSKLSQKDILKNYWINLYKTTYGDIEKMQKISGKSRRTVFSKMAEYKIKGAVRFSLIAQGYREHLDRQNISKESLGEDSQKEL